MLCKKQKTFPPLTKLKMFTAKHSSVNKCPLSRMLSILVTCNFYILHTLHFFFKSCLSSLIVSFESATPLNEMHKTTTGSHTTDQASPIGGNSAASTSSRAATISFKNDIFCKPHPCLQYKSWFNSLWIWYFY